MVEYCSSETKSTKKNKHKFAGHFLSDFAQLCLCLLSHPLYLSYFLFFLPYLLKILSFLSPLFFTTTLLLSILHDSLQLKFVKLGEEEEVDENKELELEGFEEFQVYNIVFGPSTSDPHGEFSNFGRSEQNPVQFSRENEGECSQSDPHGESSNFGRSEENPVQFSRENEGERSKSDPHAEYSNSGSSEKNPVQFCRENEGEGSKSDPHGELSNFRRSEENPVHFCRENEEECCRAAKIGTIEQNPDEEKQEKVFYGIPINDQVGESPSKEELGEEKILGVLISDEWGFPATGQNDEIFRTPSSINGGNQTQQSQTHKTHFRKRGESVWDIDFDDDSLSNLGLIRKEKEWRRTLACKLFEDRHNVGGDEEEMDLLWEAYDNTEEKRSGGLKEKKCVVDYGNLDEEEEEYEEGDNGKLCCLQALKLSAGKMNFGMGKPGFMKISRAFKGIGGGWMKNSRHRSSGGGSKKGKSN